MAWVWNHTTDRLSGIIQYITSLRAGPSFLPLPLSWPRTTKTKDTVIIVDSFILGFELAMFWASINNNFWGTFFATLCTLLEPIGVINQYLDFATLTDEYALFAARCLIVTPLLERNIVCTCTFGMFEKIRRNSERFWQTKRRVGIRWVSSARRPSLHLYEWAQSNRSSCSQQPPLPPFFSFIRWFLTHCALGVAWARPFFV